MRTPVVLLPGGVNPVDVTYSELLPHLGADVDTLRKDHELYAADAPPSGWTLDYEVDAILRAADARDWGSFHVVAYSGGGAIALALLERHAPRVRSAALVEPAWVGRPVGPDERTEIESVLKGDVSDPVGFMASFMGAPRDALETLPEWMRKRPAGLQAFAREFLRRDLDAVALRAVRAPVLYALGQNSAPVEHYRARRLAVLLPRMRTRTYPDTHHFDPPHRKVPSVFAADLRELWRDAA